MSALLPTSPLKLPSKHLSVNITTSTAPLPPRSLSLSFLFLLSPLLLPFLSFPSFLPLLSLFSPSSLPLPFPLPSLFPRSPLPLLSPFLRLLSSLYARYLPPSSPVALPSTFRPRFLYFLPNYSDYSLFRLRPSVSRAEDAASLIRAKSSVRTCNQGDRSSPSRALAFPPFSLSLPSSFIFLPSFTSILPLSRVSSTCVICHISRTSLLPLFLPHLSSTSYVSLTVPLAPFPSPTLHPALVFFPFLSFDLVLSLPVSLNFISSSHLPSPPLASP